MGHLCQTHDKAQHALHMQVEINLLTGERSVLRTDILYDCGRSLNPAIDIGQVRAVCSMHVYRSGMRFDG